MKGGTSQQTTTLRNLSHSQTFQSQSVIRNSVVPSSGSWFFTLRANMVNSVIGLEIQLFAGSNVQPILSFV